MHTANVYPRANIGNGVELRVYPLGDSITNGYQSSDDNGYRIGLQRDLAGSSLHFVGSKTGGSMSDGVCCPPFPDLYIISSRTFPMEEAHCSLVNYSGTKVGTVQR